MNSRLNNDYENMSRVSKNESLYRQINDNDINGFDVNNNATVIGNHDQDIDIEKIKKILDKRYNDTPQRRSIKVEATEPQSRLLDEDTKEYDLATVLEKAKDEKEESYEETRAKKLRNTQFDILNNLNLNKNEEEEEAIEEVVVPEKHRNGQTDLMNLINTITINESKKKEETEVIEDIDPLSIFPELKGSEDTQVCESIVEQVNVEEVNEKKKDYVVEEKKDIVDETFYTSEFKKKDFADEGSEFLEDESMGIGVKLLIVLVIIVFAIGLFLFLKSFLEI